MSILEDRANNRVANVKDIASKIAEFGEGYSVRELMDALALASGSLIRAAYRGYGVDMAVSRHIELLRENAFRE